MRCQMHEIASHAMQQHINMAAFFQQKKFFDQRSSIIQALPYMTK